MFLPFGASLPGSSLYMSYGKAMIKQLWFTAFYEQHNEMKHQLEKHPR